MQRGHVEWLVDTPVPCPIFSGDPAGPAQAAQHSRTIPAADVRRTATAPHVADGGLAAATPPQQCAAPEPGSSAAGE